MTEPKWLRTVAAAFCFVVVVLCCCHCAAATLAASVVMGADHPGVVLAAVLFNVLFFVAQNLSPLAVGSAVGLPF